MIDITLEAGDTLGRTAKIYEVHFDEECGIYPGTWLFGTKEAAETFVTRSDDAIAIHPRALLLTGEKHPLAF